MKVYKIETGIVHYAAAENLIEAIEALAALARSEGIEDWEGESHVEFEVVPEQEARGLSFWDDGEGCKRPAWDMAQECKKPEVFACSEWP